MGKVATRVRSEIHKLVEDKAAAARYESMQRNESSKFMDELTRDPLIVGKLKEFLPKDKIRTYIKDTILNRYTKRINEIPQDVSVYIREHYGSASAEVEYRKKDRSSLHRLKALGETDRYVVVARGTFMKWETALRKAIELLGTYKTKMGAGNVFELLIVIKGESDRITAGDKKSLEAGLANLGIKVSFCAGPSSSVKNG